MKKKAQKRKTGREKQQIHAKKNTKKKKKGIRFESIATIYSRPPVSYSFTTT